MLPRRPFPWTGLAVTFSIFACAGVLRGLERGASTDPGNRRVASDPVDCGRPFQRYCAEVRANKARYVPHARGKPIIDAGLRDALASVGESSFIGMAIHLLEKKGLPLGGVAIPNETLKASDDVLLWKSWFPDTLGGFYSYSSVPDAVNSILQPPELKLLDEAHLPSSAPADRPALEARVKADLELIRAQIAVIEKAIAVSEPATIFSKLVPSPYSFPSIAASPTPSPDYEPLRREVVEEFAHRNRDSVATSRLRAKLATLYVDRIYLKGARGTLLAAPEPTTTDAELKARHSALYGIRQNLSPVADLWANVVTETLNRLRDKLVLSKPLIRALESKVYSDANRAKMLARFEEARTRVSEFAESSIFPKANLDPAALKKARDELATLRLEPPAPLPDAAFRKDAETGLEIARVDEIGIAPDLQIPSTMVETLNGRLSEYLSLNAYYMYDFYVGLGEGEIQVHPRVKPYASMMYYLDDLPELVDEILAHEVGHHLGPQVSVEMGYDLPPTYLPQMGCFRKSFNLQGRQTDESFADWISAETTGLAYARRNLSAADLIRTTEKLATGSCLFDLDDRTASGLSLSHPHDIIRTDSILGGNARVRENLGCPLTGACGIEGEHP